MEGLVPLTWLTAIQLLGAVQGVFLVAILVGSKSNRTANRVLAVAMFAFSVDLITAWYLAIGLDTAYPHFLGVDFLFPFLYGPVFYTYARSVSLGGNRLPRGAAWHFLPLLALALAFIPFYLQTGEAKLAMRMHPAESPWTPWLTGLNLVKLVYSVIYLGLVFVVLVRHRRSIRDRYSSEEHVALLWLRNMLLGGVAMWTLSAVLFALWIASDGGDPLEGFDDLVSIGLAVYIYAVGYLGLRQRPLIPAAVPQGEPGRYARTGLGDETASAIKRRLEASMQEDRLFCSPDLTMRQLADHLQVSPHNLSEVLNVHLGRNFYEFVNRHRVLEVQRRIREGDDRRMTLLGLALESGFSSKSSFNATFRRVTGNTPSEYRNSLGSGVS
jgi:AraC-like DNA-binding protein